jgi:hypothetical protein
MKLEMPDFPIFQLFSAFCIIFDFAGGTRGHVISMHRPSNGNTSNEMESMEQMFNSNTRTKLRLSEIERLIRKHRIIVPPPSRPTLRKLCEDGTFETAGSTPTLMGWLVFEDSFWKWVEGLDG